MLTTLATINVYDCMPMQFANYHMIKAIAGETFYIKEEHMQVIRGKFSFHAHIHASDYRVIISPLTPLPAVMRWLSESGYLEIPLASIEKMDICQNVKSVNPFEVSSGSISMTNGILTPINFHNFSSLQLASLNDIDWNEIAELASQESNKCQNCLNKSAINELKFHDNQNQSGCASNNILMDSHYTKVNDCNKSRIKFELSPNVPQEDKTPLHSPTSKDISTGSMVESDEENIRLKRNVNCEANPVTSKCMDFLRSNTEHSSISFTSELQPIHGSFLPVSISNIESSVVQKREETFICKGDNGGDGLCTCHSMMSFYPTNKDANWWRQFVENRLHHAILATEGHVDSTFTCHSMSTLPNCDRLISANHSSPASVCNRCFGIIRKKESIIKNGDEKDVLVCDCEDAFVATEAHLSSLDINGVISPPPPFPVATCQDSNQPLSIGKVHKKSGDLEITSKMKSRNNSFWDKIFSSCLTSSSSFSSSSFNTPPKSPPLPSCCCVHPPSTVYSSFPSSSCCFFPRYRITPTQLAKKLLSHHNIKPSRLYPQICPQPTCQFYSISHDNTSSSSSSSSLLDPFSLAYRFQRPLSLPPTAQSPFERALELKLSSYHAHSQSSSNDPPFSPQTIHPTRSVTFQPINSPPCEPSLSPSTRKSPSSSTRCAPMVTSKKLHVLLSHHVDHAALVDVAIDSQSPSYPSSSSTSSSERSSFVSKKNIKSHALLSSRSPTSIVTSFPMQIEVRDGRWFRFICDSDASRQRIFLTLQRLAFPSKSNLMFAFIQPNAAAGSSNSFSGVTQSDAGNNATATTTTIMNSSQVTARGMPTVQLNVLDTTNNNNTNFSYQDGNNLTVLQQQQLAHKQSLLSISQQEHIKLTGTKATLTLHTSTKANNGTSASNNNNVIGECTMSQIPSINTFFDSPLAAVDARVGWRLFNLEEELRFTINNAHTGLKTRFARVLKSIAQTVQKTPHLSRFPTVEELFNPSADGLRMSLINRRFHLCPSYPALLGIPASLNDDVISALASGRSKQRIVALSWAHKGNGATLWRCSQPRVRLLRNSGDRAIFHAIQNIHFPQQLLNLLQSPVTAALDSNAAANSFTSVPASSPSAPSSTANPASNNTASKNKLSSKIAAILGVDDPGRPEPILIVDCRSYTAALANTAKGGGFESFPASLATVKFVDIANIHAVRNAFKSLCVTVRSLEDAAATPPFRLQSWGQQIDASKWLCLVGDVLYGSRRVALELAAGRPCVVHCSDGWDRTSQLCALAKLLLDARFRTLEGFIKLIELDFLNFGHRFHTRMGMVGGKDAGLSFQNDSTSNAPVSSKDFEEDVSFEDTQDSDQVSPVFIQFLDCVFQIMRQFPAEFTFRPSLLPDIAFAAYSGRYGTFMFDTQRERESAKLSSCTASYWTEILANADKYENPAYFPKSDTLDVSPATGALALWEGYFLRFAPCFRASVAAPEIAAKAALDRIRMLEARLAQVDPKALEEVRQEILNNKTKLNPTVSTAPMNDIPSIAVLSNRHETVAITSSTDVNDNLVGEANIISAAEGLGILEDGSNTPSISGELSALTDDAE